MTKREAADAPVSGYFGRPVVKPPVWTWEVPLYFFVGGLAGGASVIAAVGAAARMPKALVLPALWIAVVGAALSALLLVLDLGRPKRFLNMLRIFKPSSAMSMGAWILTGFSGAATLALAAALLDLGPVVFWLGAAPAAVLGALLATYTGVLIGVTAIPAWAAHDRALPAHFGAAGLGSAAAALVLATGGAGWAGSQAGPLVTILVATTAVETALWLWLLIKRHGVVDRALRRGWPAALVHGGGALTGPVALALTLPPITLYAASACFLAGALANRFGWLLAGRASGRDPEAALAMARGTHERA